MAREVNPFVVTGKINRNISATGNRNQHELSSL